MKKLMPDEATDTVNAILEGSEKPAKRGKREPKVKPTKALVICGNLSDGYRHVGPFKSLDAAFGWADGMVDVWVVTLEDPATAKEHF